MSWIVEISAAERAGRPAPATLQAAQRALQENGCVLLRGVFSTAAVDQLRTAFDAQWGARSQGDMDDVATRGGASPVLRVGAKRYEVLLKLQGAFADPMLFAGPILFPFLASTLGRDMKISGVTAVVSYPGAELQHIHSDHPLLFEQDALSTGLPSYAINVSVPLIDVDQAIGPTAVCLGSHLWPASRAATPGELASIDLQRGDCLLIDYRTRHAGMPNTSTTVRPILYMVYARKWFFDDINHVSRPSLNMPLEAYENLPEPVKPLLSRAYSAQMRARYFNQT